MTTGGYEFVTTDHHGLINVARWVPRPSRSQRRSNAGPNRTTTITNKLNGDERAFNFSLINPNYRRHPIIASMSRSRIDVLDIYPTSAPSAIPQSPTSCASATRSSFFESGLASEPSLARTDDRLRTLILVTGIWVAFREGWSESFRYHDPLASPGNGTSRRSASNPVWETAGARPSSSSASPHPRQRDGLVSRTRSNATQRPVSPGHRVNVSLRGHRQRRHTQSTAPAVSTSMVDDDLPMIGAAEVAAHARSPPNDDHDNDDDDTLADTTGSFPHTSPVLPPDMAPRPVPSRAVTEDSDPGQTGCSFRRPLGGPVSKHPSTKRRWGNFKALFRLTGRRQQDHKSRLE